jgi:hypothetical protein
VTKGKRPDRNDKQPNFPSNLKWLSLGKKRESNKAGSKRQTAQLSTSNLKWLSLGKKGKVTRPDRSGKQPNFPRQGFLLEGDSSRSVVPIDRIHFPALVRGHGVPLLTAVTDIRYGL